MCKKLGNLHVVTYLEHIFLFKISLQLICQETSECNLTDSCHKVYVFAVKYGYDVNKTSTFSIPARKNGASLSSRM